MPNVNPDLLTLCEILPVLVWEFSRYTVYSFTGRFSCCSSLRSRSNEKNVISGVANPCSSTTTGTACCSTSGSTTSLTTPARSGSCTETSYKKPVFGTVKKRRKESAALVEDSMNLWWKIRTSAYNKRVIYFCFSSIGLAAMKEETLLSWDGKHTQRQIDRWSIAWFKYILLR